MIRTRIYRDYGLKDETVTQRREGSRCMKADVFTRRRQRCHETVIQVSLWFLTFKILDLTVRVGVFLFFFLFSDSSIRGSR